MKHICVFFPHMCRQSFQTYNTPWRRLITFLRTSPHFCSQATFLICCIKSSTLPVSLWLLWVLTPAVMFPWAMLTRAHTWSCLKPFATDLPELFDWELKLVRLLKQPGAVLTKDEPPQDRCLTLRLMDWLGHWQPDVQFSSSAVSQKLI